MRLDRSILPFALATLSLALGGCTAFDHSPQALTRSIAELNDDGSIVYTAAKPPSKPVAPRRESRIASDANPLTPNLIAKEGTETPLERTVVRGQSPDGPTNEGYSRGPQEVSEAPRLAQQPGYGTATYPGYGNSTPIPNNNHSNQPPPNGAYGSSPNPTQYEPPIGFPAQGRPYPVPFDGSPNPGTPDVNLPTIPGNPPTEPPALYTPLDIHVSETRTGRFMFGMGVNSDAGVTGQITIDERNFDIFNPPRSWDDWVNGTAFRGAGQGFRIEAQPGNQVQRYLVNFTEPYLFDTPITFNASAFYFERNYFDYLEDRVGGRLALGYRLTPDLSVSAAVRAEDVKISQPRVNTVAELNDMLGSTDFYSGRVNIIHDTRDNAFLATQGHYLELAYEQAFGEFSYPRGELDWRQFFTVSERPDGSGKHTVCVSAKVGVSGDDTPMFENFYAGGYSTLRGYSFRGASPQEDGVRTGGVFKFLGSAEYFFPLTADDMFKGTVFADFGTVEREVEINDFRVAPGVGLLFNIPALGPAPLAVNFAFPLNSNPFDNEQVFSFYFGAMR